MTELGADLSRAYDPEQFREAGRKLIDDLSDYLHAAQGRSLPVLPPSDPDELCALYARTLAQADRGRAAVPALDELVSQAMALVNHLHHPRYIGHQVTAPLPEAALLELVSALSNNGAAVFEMGTVELAMERALASWMSNCLGLGSSADGIFTSGGSAGNLTALLAARQEQAGFDVWREGVHGGAPLCVLVSDQAHYSVKRSLQIAGLGEGGVELVPVDARFKLRPELLPQAQERAEARGRKVIAVVGSAGSTATGSYDPLQPIAEYCQSRELWFHVDGAHGAYAALSPKLRPLIAGIENADSVVWDAHKMLLMPALVTAVLFRDGSRSYEAFAQQASYLFGDVQPQEEWFNLGSRTLECTKRWMVLPLYVALARRGTAFFQSYVERAVALAAEFASEIQAAADFELGVQPESNIVCFRYLPRRFQGALVPDGESERQALDRVQAEIRAALLRSGEFYIVQTRLPRGLYLRVTIINPLTTAGDLQDLLRAVRDLARKIPA
ncbi:MAG TPA: pyridoxal-dependent decarboxylase [Polyangiaceae bacterium]|jgi:L-2,4-diaminobutyrate decarboxylase|nr:pyridoxal-dependent decarboxylase [Polyangiaceae bacterium]